MLKLVNNIKKRVPRVVGTRRVTRKMVTNEEYVRRLTITVASNHEGVEQQGGR